MRMILFAAIISLCFIAGGLNVYAQSNDSLVKNADNVENAYTVENASAVGNATTVQNANTIQNATTVTANAPPYSTWILLMIVLILVLSASIPLMYNNYQAHQHLHSINYSLKLFLENHKDDPIDDNTLRVIKEYINAEPRGAPGTARVTFAITIISIVGICLFLLLIYPASRSDQIIKDIILALTGALTAIIGFYFGANGSQEPKTLESTPPVTKPPVAAPQKPKKEEIYLVKEEFTHDDKKYFKDTKVDLSDIPEDVRKGWIKDEKIELFVGGLIEDTLSVEDKGTKKDIPRDVLLPDNKLRPGWYKIESNFRHNDDRYISGNIMNLKDVPARVLEEWKRRDWIVEYYGPVAGPQGSES